VSYCLNPNCPNPADPLNDSNRICRHCGSSLAVRGYRVKHLLGEGGFAKTFEITDERGTAKVLKVLLDTNPKAVSLFQREARVLASLQHPGIPQVEPDGYFTYFPHNSQQPLHCLVMEKIEGSNLEKWLSERNNRPIAQNQALVWLKQLAEILQQIHQEQYFHRDIKPSNIMLRPSGELVLIDFGTVRQVTGTYLAKVGGGHQVTGIVSPGYTPPEQANGKAVPQSDFYALGRTFVCLLTGTDPNEFPENPRTGELLWRDRVRHLTPAVADLIDYLMAPFPGNRPQNAGVILQRIAELERPDFQPQAYQPVPRTANYRMTPLASLPRSRSKRRSSAKSGHKKFTKLKAQLLKSGAWLLFAGSSAALLLTLAGAELHNSWAPSLNPHLGISPKQNSQQGSPPSQNALQKAALAKTLYSHTGGVNAVAISPDGQELASGSVDKTVKIWDLRTGELLLTLSGHTSEVWAIAISPDGKTLASGSGDRTIKLWDMATGELRYTLSGHSGPVSALAFSPDGQKLASGSYDNAIKLWDTDTGTERSTLNGHTDSVTALAFSPNGKTLASASADTTVKLWDLGAGCADAVPCAPPSTLYGHSSPVESLAISPDGKTLASGSRDGTINLWELGTGKQRDSLFGHSASVNALAFTPDGQTLASGGGPLEDTIKLWNLRSGELLRTLSGHSDTVHALTFSQNGQILLSGSEDYTIKVWQMR
jgi:WD40 repeat protein